MVSGAFIRKRPQTSPLILEAVMEAEVAIFDINLSNMPTLQKINQKLNPMIPSTKLHHFSFFRAIFAFLATHPVPCDISFTECDILFFMKCDITFAKMI